MLDSVQYLDSSDDDDVKFGKYTIEEAKADIKKYRPKKLNRRHTLTLKLADTAMDSVISTEDIELLNTDFQEKNKISLNPSEYLTPNGSLLKEKPLSDSDFIQKLTQVINQSSETSYKTACDYSNVKINVTNSDISTESLHLDNGTTVSLDSSQETVENNSVYDVNVSNKFSDDYNLSEGDDYTDLSEGVISISDESTPTTKLSSEIPKITFDQSDESFNFDDTLEEITKFLEKDVYTPVNTVTLLPRFDELSERETKLNEYTSHSPSEITAIAYKSPKLYNTRTITKCPIKAKPKCTTTSKILLHDNEAKQKTQEVFKIPIKPVQKLHTPKKPSNTYLKNVVSPVRIYINNTPKYSPLKKCPQNPKIHTSKLVKSDYITKKENIPLSKQDILPAIYQPSKAKIVTNKKDVNLPENINKFLKENVVTKHEAKIKGHEFNTSLERKLMESDFSIDCDLSQDVSVLVNKQAFNMD